MQELYNHSEIEAKQQKKWIQNKTFNVNENSNKKKYYCLSMLPYPSGRLHMGHARNYSIGDAISRFYTLLGYNVLQPYGWDAFGLPAENAAIQNNIAPSKWTIQNIEHMRHQLQSLGLAVDWDREITTCDPEYYKWQQWLFIKLYEKGIIYKKNGIVNWDPVDKTVLANEQVIDGKGWRSGAEVEKKEIPMYYFKITNYAEELLNDIDTLDGWPDKVKAMQRNWIGKSVGVELSFLKDKENNTSQDIKVYTTRLDTLMGVTYIAISYEHNIAKTLIQNPIIKDFIDECKKGSVTEEELATMEKKGIFSGIYVIHPITLEKIPVWIANYVLTNYGTGAVMGVPAHCPRDFEFAKKYDLEIKIVIKKQGSDEYSNLNAAFEDTEGTISINSGKYDNLTFKEIYDSIKNDLIKNNLCEEKINYRLRDWGISRQRYWGCPIPIIHCEYCKEVLAPMEELPVKLPLNVNFEAHGNVLNNMPEFYETTCPKCHAKARRETDTMDTFVDSSWYFMRYASYNSNEQILDKRANYWLPVDQYIGGIEHAILHLLYARFIHKAMRDIGIISSNEPFQNLLSQGMVLAETFYRNNANGQKSWFNPNDISLSKDDKGNIIEAISKIDNQKVEIGGLEKMSKSKNNGIDPDIIIRKYGADTLRVFMLFAAPVEQTLEWSSNGIEGANRFVKKIWRYVFEHQQKGIITKKHIDVASSDNQKKLQTQLELTIKKVTKDYQDKHFNTAIASIMELLNSYNKIAFISDSERSIAQELLEKVIILLYPITPHICEELWQTLVPNSNLLDQPWPTVNEALLINNDFEMIIQVNGKLRGKILVSNNMNEDIIKNLAINNENVKKFIDGKEIKKIIYVPKKLINIVV